MDFQIVVAVVVVVSLGQYYYYWVSWVLWMAMFDNYSFNCNSHMSISNNSEDAVTGSSPLWTTDPLHCTVVALIHSSRCADHVSISCPSHVVPSRVDVVGRSVVGGWPRLTLSCGVGVMVSVAVVGRSSTADVPRSVATTPYDPLTTTVRRRTTRTVLRPRSLRPPLRSERFHVVGGRLFHHPTLLQSTDVINVRKNILRNVKTRFSRKKRL